MKRHDRRATGRVPELGVTTALTNLIESSASQCANDVRSGDDREPRGHAAISTEAMIGGSAPSGRGSSSK
jgi:hypothetical protein